MLARRVFIAVVFAILSVLAAEPASAESLPAPRPAPLSIWFREPAASYVESCPVGNGRLGATLLGGVAQERIVLNEQTLWSGSPQDADRKNAHEVLPEIRRLLLAGDNRRAQELLSRSFICKGPGSSQGNAEEGPFGCYQTLGDLLLDFGPPGGEIRDYRRELDLDSAIARVRYVCNGVTHTRELFASAPDQVIVVHLSADQPGALSFVARVHRKKRASYAFDGNDGLLMSGQLHSGRPDAAGTRYAARMRVVLAGGTLTPEDTPEAGLTVKGADAATLFITAGTDYQDTSFDRTTAERLAAAVNLPSMAGAKSTREHRWPMPVALADVRMTGELAKRLSASFDRLEEEWYRPAALYDSPNDGWPGDKEGRTLLGLVLLSQVTGRTARYLEDSLNLYPQKVNARGYLGPTIVPNVIPEQTLGGQFWLVRAFYEYEAWKNDKQVSAWADQVLRNVYLSAAGSYRRYPINPSERQSQGFVYGTAVGRSGKWILSSDIGCGLAGSLDALTEAYARHPSEETGQVIEEVIQRFLEADLEAVSAQLHSTLIATRSLLRHFETTGREELLRAAASRYHLYRERAMTDTFENHNWFRRPEWTEGCAVVDSFIAAVQLWRFTGDVKYLEDAHHIYYNGLCVNQRSNGGLGCDSCPSRDNPFLTIKTQEARWCCTQRGADGLAKAAQYCFFRDQAGIIVPFYQDAQATLRWGGQSLTLREKTGYPWEGTVRLEVAAAKCDEARALSLFIPSWAIRPILKLNGQQQQATSRGGFFRIQQEWKVGDVVELSFEQGVVARSPVNRVNGADRGEYHTFHYGPLILGYPGPKAVTLKPDTRFHRKGERDFAVEETDVILQPIYHLLDPAVSMDRGYQRQILFRSHE